MSRAAACPLPHVEPTKLQVDVAVWSQMQQAMADALAAQRDISDKIAQAVAAERAASQAIRSDDVTGVQAGNRILRDQLAAANEDMKDRDRRILELLTRADTLQQEIATLKSERAEIALANHREQRSLELARAQLQSSDDRFKAVVGHLAPLAPLLARVGVQIAAARPTSAPFAADSSPSTASEPMSAAGVGDASSEPEVLQAAVWTQNRIEEWKQALCDLILASSPETAAAFRFSLAETNILGMLSAPPEALPDMVRALIAEAGPERIARLQVLTAAARPG